VLWQLLTVYVSPETRVKTTQMATYVSHPFIVAKEQLNLILKIPGCLRNACLSVAEAVENAMVRQISAAGLQ